MRVKRELKSQYRVSVFNLSAVWSIRRCLIIGVRVRHICLQVIYTGLWHWYLHIKNFQGDKFRYNLLYKKGGWWVDTDIICLKKEFDILKESIPNIYTQPDEDNILVWNYIIIPSKEPYKGGYYHGILEFHKDYPMKPPSIKMFTPSGRFETNTRICLSMSDYHPETWNPSWGVRTILLGLYSFMIEDEFSDGTIGSIMDSFDNRKKLALSSYDYNLSNKKFQELCKELIHVKSVKHNPRHDKIICRYCFEDTGTLIAPCNCEGSNKYVHQECLAKWQYNSILSQSTHPKYQTNIEKICNVCGSEFKFKEYSRDKLMLQFTGKEIEDIKNQNPGIKVIAHPECPPDVIEASDFAGSTSGMVKYVKENQPKKVMLVTECSMSDNVEADNPNVSFIKPCNLCPYMKKINLEKILDCLENETNEIVLDNQTIEAARKSVIRMTEIGR